VPIIVNFEQFFVPLVFLSTLEAMGRKTLIQTGCIISAIATGLIGGGFLIRES
jgi:hypothetical protein